MKYWISIQHTAAPEAGKDGFGRIRLRRIPNNSAEEVVPFVQDNIELGTQVRTDGSGAYPGLKGLGYAHHRTILLGSDVPAHVSMAGVHQVASLIERWIHGSAQAAPLDAYLDEFVFRSNRRTSASRGRLFHRLLQASRHHRPGDLRGRHSALDEAGQDGVVSGWAPVHWHQLELS